LAFLAVALCVFIVVVVMTVMTGLVSDFKKKNHAFVGDCIVSTKSLVGFAYYKDFIKILEQTDFIEAISPVIKSYALVSPSWTDKGFGLEVMGIDAVNHSRATDFGKTLHYRKDEVSKAFEPVYDANLLGCVVGVDTRINWKLRRDANGGYSFGVTPDQIAFSISCVPLTSRGALAKAGTDMVNTKTFYYSDASHSGLARVDASTVYLPFEWAQRLCGMDGSDKRINAIYIKFKPDEKLEAGCQKV
ncbi:unnamed protein product, partial [marine sediment metagenome]